MLPVCTAFLNAMTAGVKVGSGSIGR